MVPGEVLETDVDGLLLHGIDSGNVRRVDELAGDESRECDDAAFALAMESAPPALAMLMHLRPRA
jgi:hypothetical protein